LIDDFHKFMVISVLSLYFSTCYPLFTRVVFIIDIEPNRPCQAEGVNEKDQADGNQQPKGSSRAPAQQPVKKGDKANAKEGGKDVGDKHGAKVVTRLWHKIHIAMRAVPMHVKGFLHTEGARLKQIAFVAFGAFEPKGAIYFIAFPENTHFNARFNR
jgi:hypothetical protein